MEEVTSAYFVNFFHMKNKDLFGEFAVFKEITKRHINAMYMFEWAGKEYQPAVSESDGLLKDVILPVDEERYERFVKVNNYLWNNKALYKYFPDTEIFFFKDGAAIGKARFRVIVFTVPLCELIVFLEALRGHGLISGGKILRAVIVDGGMGSPREYGRRYSGIPEDGFDEFWVGILN